jgi:hypothetical protein
MDWTKIVTHPLGLAAFALALIFGVAGVRLQGRQGPWFLPAALIIAAIALIGCFYLANRQIDADREVAHPAAPASTQPSKRNTQPSLAADDNKSSRPSAPATVHQETRGAGSPTIQGVQGDVTITIDQGGRKHK